PRGRRPLVSQTRPARKAAGRSHARIEQLALAQWSDRGNRANSTGRTTDRGIGGIWDREREIARPLRRDVRVSSYGRRGGPLRSGKSGLLGIPVTTMHHGRGTLDTPPRLTGRSVHFRGGRYGLQRDGT